MHATRVLNRRGEGWGNVLNSFTQPHFAQNPISFSDFYPNPSPIPSFSSVILSPANPNPVKKGQIPVSTFALSDPSSNSLESI